MGYETINTKNVTSIVVYEKDEAAMFEVDQLNHFVKELYKGNRDFSESLSSAVSFEALKELINTHLVQQQYALRSHIYECS